MHLILEELSECLAGKSDVEDECIVKELPEDCDLYGNINHTGKETPQNDCEFVSVFLGRRANIHNERQKLHILKINNRVA